MARIAAEAVSPAVSDPHPPQQGLKQLDAAAELGDAAAHALILRQRDNAAFREGIARLDPDAAAQPFHEDAPFTIGLYADTEMFVDSFLALMDAGVNRIVGEPLRLGELVSNDLLQART